VAAAQFKVLLRYSGWGSSTPNISHHHTTHEAVEELRGNSRLVGGRQESVYTDEWNIDWPVHMKVSSKTSQMWSLLI